MRKTANVIAKLRNSQQPKANQPNARCRTLDARNQGHRRAGVRRLQRELHVTHTIREHGPLPEKRSSDATGVLRLPSRALEKLKHLRSTNPISTFTTEAHPHDPIDVQQDGARDDLEARSRLRRKTAVVSMVDGHNPLLKAKSSPDRLSISPQPPPPHRSIDHRALNMMEFRGQNAWRNFPSSSKHP